MERKEKMGIFIGALNERYVIKSSTLPNLKRQASRLAGQRFRKVDRMIVSCEGEKTHMYRVNTYDGEKVTWGSWTTEKRDLVQNDG